MGLSHNINLDKGK